jgi:hypothetical protein
MLTFYESLLAAPSEENHEMETLFTGKFTLGVLSEENHEKLWLVKDILFTDIGRKHLLAFLPEEIRINSAR